MSGPATKETTRQQIILAAAHQFARKSYSLVSLDDILDAAQLTKGAMYFHFRSKQALALAIIDEFKARTRTALEELLGRKLSGLETIIDASYLFAYQAIVDSVARSVMHLVESVGRTDGLVIKLADEWSLFYTRLLRRAVNEGDVVPTQDPEVIGRLLASLYAGVRQVSDPDKPDEFLGNLRDVWLLVLPGLVPQGRTAYFDQFIRRRNTLVLNRIAGCSDAGEPPASSS